MADQTKKMEKIKEVFADEQFVNELMEMDSVQEVQAALHEKDLDLSEEELNATREVLIKMAENGGTELSDEELENVAGGIIPFAVAAVAMIGGCTAGGLAIFSIREWRW